MVRVIIILTLCLIYILVNFISSEMLRIIFDIVAVAVFLSLVPLLEKNKRIFTLTLFSLGIVIHISVGDRGLDMIQGVTQNMALLSILILAPLLSIPLNREGIMDTVTLLLNEMKSNPRKTFYGISSFMLTLAPILNMGALRIVHGFVEKIDFQSKLLSKAYYYGFTPAVMWSPFFASVGIVIYYLDITYLSYALVGIVFSVIQVVIGYVIFRPRNQLNYLVVQEKHDNSEISRRKKDLFLLIGFVMGLVLLLIFLEQMTHKSMLLLVSIICVAVPTIWVVVRKQVSILKEEMQKYKDRLIMQKTEICLFLSAGLFGNAISHTHVKDYLESVMQWSATQSIVVLFIFILLFVTFFAFLGVHQIIVIPLILTSLNFAEIEISILSVAFMCIFAWMLSSAISPVNAMNIIISNCVRKDGITVAYRWNGLYFLTITGLAFAYVIFINRL